VTRDLSFLLLLFRPWRCGCARRRATPRPWRGRTLTSSTNNGLVGEGLRYDSRTRALLRQRGALYVLAGGALTGMAQAWMKANVEAALRPKEAAKEERSAGSKFKIGAAADGRARGAGGCGRRRHRARVMAQMQIC